MSMREKPVSWTAEDDARLREMWADESLSSAEIGRRMGRGKNSVVGRAHRLRLPSRASPITARLTEGRHAAKRPGRVRQDGAAALRAALRNGAGARPQQIIPAEAFRRHGHEAGGGRVSSSGDSFTGPAVTPAAAAGAAGTAPAHLPPPAAPVARAAVLSGGAACRWPMWGSKERPTHVYCGEPPRLRADGSRCVYCACHAARAFTMVGGEAAELERPAITRRTFAWGGRAA